MKFTEKKTRQLSVLPAGVFFVLMLTGPGPAMGQSGLKSIFELDPDDNFTIKPQVVITECTKALESQRGMQPQDVKMAYQRRGLAYLQSKRCAEALKDFDSLCKLSPKDAFARCLRAEALANLGRIHEADEDMRKALDLDPTSPIVYEMLAYMSLGRGDLQEACKAVNKAINLDPNFAHGYYTRALVYLRQQNARRCLEDIDHFILLSPGPGLFEDPSEPYRLRGHALLMLNRPRAALSTFLLAYRLNPSSAYNAGSVCKAYADMGKWHSATVMAEECVRLDPANIIGWLFCADCYAETGRKQEALQALGKMLTLAPKDAMALTGAGNVYRKLGQYEQSLSYYDKALAVMPTMTEARAGKALIFAACPEFKFRDGAKALKLARWLYTETSLPEWTKCHSALILATAQAEVGDYGEAVRLARRAVELSGSEPYKRRECEARLKLFEAKKPYRLRVRVPQPKKKGSESEEPEKRKGNSTQLDSCTTSKGEHRESTPTQTRSTQAGPAPPGPRRQAAPRAGRRDRRVSQFLPCPFADDLPLR
jgi:tetratricopeptide (TPR) repeat protein